MSETASRTDARPAPGARGAGLTFSPGLALRIGWRNLWRNRRRTWLTAGGVAFAIFLVVFAMCVQFGSYATMEETATSLLTGHIQIQHPEYVEDSRFDATLTGVAALAQRVGALPGVTATAPRIEAFALASAGERAFGAQVLGISPEREAGVVDFHQRIVRGRQIEAPQEGVLGEGLARNLGVDLGDEVVLLGSARQGGVAALAVTVVGVFATGMAELDRALMLAPLEDVREAFDLTDQAHTLVVRSADLTEVDTTARELRDALAGRGSAGSIQVRTWAEVLPELRQAIDIDRVSGELFYWIIMLLVAFSVVNTFIMTVFERTREFGVLLAIGMRPARIIVMLQWEALFMWALGTAIGLLLALVVVGVLAEVGIYLGESMEEYAATMYMPTRLYPSFSTRALLTAPLVMLVGTCLAALLPALRVRRIRPVDAIRAAE